MLNRLCGAAEFVSRRRLLGSIFNVLSCFQELDESRRKTVKLPLPSAMPHCQFCEVTVGTHCVTVLLWDAEWWKRGGRKSSPGNCCRNKQFLLKNNACLEFQVIFSV